jgi:lysophospholipase L1-like esterase
MSAALRRLFMPFTSIVATIGLLLVAPGSASAQPQLDYVALGDSFASGPLIPNQRPDPIGCGRSDRNYATLVADDLDVASFVDVTCGGATTRDMTAPQSVPLGTAPPQFDALRQDTDLVTVTISGNDIGFIDIVTTCAQKSVTDPFGNPCQRHYTSGGTDQLADRINETAAKVRAVLDGIAQRSPHATIVLVGYLRILPPSGGCWPVFPLAFGDVPYLDGTEHKLNLMLGQQAAAAGARFVNPGITTGHDACQTPTRKWVEGLIPTSLAAPVHPNARGMAEVARLVTSAIEGLD